MQTLIIIVAGFDAAKNLVSFLMVMADAYDADGIQ